MNNTPAKINRAAFQNVIGPRQSNAWKNNAAKRYVKTKKKQYTFEEQEASKYATSVANPKVYNTNTAIVRNGLDSCYF